VTLYQTGCSVADPSASRRIVVAETGPSVGENFATMCAEAGYAVKQAENGEAALVLITEHRPGVALLDIHLRGLSCEKVIRACSGERTRFVAIIDREHDTRYYLQAGATGVVLRSISGERLADALNYVVNGGLAIHGGIAALLRSCARRRVGTAGEVLSSREFQVYQRLVNGASGAAIAYELGMSLRTVKWHRASIMHKLAVTSVADLAELADRESPRREKLSQVM
jgi:two-component system, NarL family, nitrate/nitrite response regulator NarL